MSIYKSYYVSFAAVAVSFTHTIKALEPFFNAVVSKFILDQQISLPLWLSLAPVVLERCVSILPQGILIAMPMNNRYKKNDDSLSNSIANADDDIQKVQSEIEVLLKKDQQNRSSIRDLRLHQTNKVTDFGGNRVTNLLRAIERHHYRFGKPPIGPIGADLGTYVKGIKEEVVLSPG
ncbi:hypothetical protein POM88_000588 [Heracleum sosnowskyi]|uniref:Sugar phosphate transporter domain-containing protein n=1 Tax=Heracleum sosnowskyi TaxID=360622 RepID=A0AAD8NAZ1_9APIA|nr:hypothetical protein POM88_000588 [Heracleum sosnowskyi]